MTDLETQAQAMISAAIAQRNQAQDALVQMAGELALVKAAIADLKAIISKHEASAPLAEREKSDKSSKPPSV